jgi:hypothetical protein
MTGVVSDGSRELLSRALTSIDAAELLEEHDKRSDGNTLKGILCPENLRILPQLLQPAVRLPLVGELGEILPEDAFLKDTLSLDLKQLDLNKLVVGIGATQACEGLDRVVHAALLDEPARGVGEEPDADGEDDSGNALDYEREAPCPVGLAFAGAADVVRAVGDPVGNHDSDRDSELLHGDEQASDLGGCELGVVEGAANNMSADVDILIQKVDSPRCRQCTNADTSEETTSVKIGTRAGASGQVRAEDDPEAASEDRALAREDFAGDAGDEGAGPAGELEDGGEPALGTGVVGDLGEAAAEGVHDEGLAEDGLLVTEDEAALGAHGLEGVGRRLGG